MRTPPYYVGTDTNNAMPFPTGGAAEHFYIGRLGGELTASSVGFDAEAARALPAAQVYGYWDLGGPSHPGRPANQTAGAWGAAQAAAAVEVLHETPSVGGKTLFLDTEAGNGGWATDIGLNRLVMAGALHQLDQAVGVVPGVYISPRFWSQSFGTTGWIPGIAFVLYVAGTSCPSDAARAMAGWETLPAIGGMRPMIWQFHVAECVGAAQDWDVTPYNGFIRGAWQPTPVMVPVSQADMVRLRAQISVVAADLQEVAKTLAAIEQDAKN